MTRNPPDPLPVGNLRPSRTAKRAGSQPQGAGGAAGALPAFSLRIFPLSGGGLRVDVLPVAPRAASPPAVNPSVGRFVAERLQRVPGASVQARTLYRAFQAWCAALGEPSPSEKVFAASMLAAGAVRQNSRIRQYLNLAIKE